MPFKFKLSKRLALLKGSLVLAGALVAVACERTDLSAPEAPSSLDTQLVSPPPGTIVVASAHDGNVPQNTRDKNPATRWSALGDGQWIRYDLGTVMTVDRLDIAWYAGNAWASAFDIEMSPDTVTWSRVYAGRSSGLTLQPEPYAFPAASGRYVRIVGHGQWRGTTPLSMWTSITEVAIYWSPAATPPPPPPAAPTPVATVAVSAASASVSLGATYQLSAVAKDSNGNVLSGRSITWTSSTPAVATVSPSGLVTGLAIGSAMITATSEGKSGSAVLTVSSADAGVGPRPGPTATIIFQDGFESGNLSLWEQIPGNGRYSVTTDAARVKSGARAMQTLYTPTNGYGMITRWFMPGYDEVYVKFYVMFQEGFQNMRDDGHGMHFFSVGGNRIDNSRSSFGTAGRRPNGTDFYYAGLDPEYIQNDPTLRPFSYYTYWPDMSGSYGQITTQPSAKTPLIGGQWQEVVFHIKMNTPGQRNGSQTVWINGVKKLDMQNMGWRNTTDLRINQIRFDNYMPGGRKTQYIWLDDVTVWRP